MKRRKLLTTSAGMMSKGFLLRTIGLAGLIPLSTNASRPAAAFQSHNLNEILQLLFGTTNAGEDAGILISTSQNAESAVRIPFRITARHSEKVAILIENHIQPLVLVANTKNYPEGVVMGTLDLEKSALLTCYALRQGELFSRSKFINLGDDGF